MLPLEHQTFQAGNFNPILSQGNSLQECCGIFPGEKSVQSLWTVHVDTSIY